jgi:hypothetical protein
MVPIIGYKLIFKSIVLFEKFRIFAADLVLWPSG